MTIAKIKPWLIAPISLIAFSNMSIATESTGDEWDQEWAEFEESDTEVSPWSWQTSMEASTAFRTRNDPAISNDATLAEFRNNWAIYYERNNLKATLKADLIADNIESNQTHDTREANIYYRISDYLELKAGRQILTWGTGDLIFLNDMFPKDWKSFFSGRDTQYLKAPSDALKTSIYTNSFNIDVIYTPTFDNDTYVDGERLSYYSPLTQQYVAASSTLSVNTPDDSFKDDEISLRISGKQNGLELALYYYDGFFKSPNGLETVNNELVSTFTKLRVIGASARTSTKIGIINGEIAAYHSLDDRKGTDPLIPNDQDRILIGYETEAITNLNVGFQYYLEITKDYQDLKSNSPFPNQETKEHRSVFTNRLTYQSGNRVWTYSLFSFYSTSDKDGYIRPSMNYRYSDKLHISGGGNYIFGDKPHTFFNRFENNSNIYIRAKYYL